MADMQEFANSRGLKAYTRALCTKDSREVGLDDGTTRTMYSLELVAEKLGQEWDEANTIYSAQPASALLEGAQTQGLMSYPETILNGRIQEIESQKAPIGKRRQPS